MFMFLSPLLFNDSDASSVFSVPLQISTRMHFSGMRTARLPTMCVLLATTRCPYLCGGHRSSSERV